jgi:nicotinamidase-related amidase
MGKKALVVVDLQVGFMSLYTCDLPRKINNFISKYRKTFDYIISTQYINNEGTPCYVFENWTDCMSGSPESKLINFPHDVNFRKSVYSCYNEEFKAYMRKNDITDLYFCGISTACCVLHSAFDSYNDLVSTYVISDLCGSSRHFQSHENALQVLRECITEQRVITTEEYANRLN